MNADLPGRERGVATLDVVFLKCPDVPLATVLHPDGEPPVSSLPGFSCCSSASRWSVSLELRDTRPMKNRNTERESSRRLGTKEPVVR
jgi:hypothetical protein